MVGPGEPVPKGGGVYRVGSPYVVAGQTYVPQDDPNYRAEGLASWYGDDFHGRYTANGEIFDKDGITAAHTTLPLPSYVRVTNLTNGKSLIVRVNDRGPYAHNRLIDVSTRAAHLLGFYNRGTVPVRVEYVGRAPDGGLRRSHPRSDLARPRAGAGAVEFAARLDVHHAAVPAAAAAGGRSPLHGGAGHHRIVRSAKGGRPCRLPRRRRAPTASTFSTAAGFIDQPARV